MCRLCSRQKASSKPWLKWHDRRAAPAQTREAIPCLYQDNCEVEPRSVYRGFRKLGVPYFGVRFIRVLLLYLGGSIFAVELLRSLTRKKLSGRGKQQDNETDENLKVVREKEPRVGKTCAD